MKKAILINDTSNEFHIGCDAVIYSIKQLCMRRNIEIIKTFTRKETKDGIYIDFLNNIDLIIINGEGSCHDDYGREWLSPLISSISNNIKVVLINSVWNNMRKIKGIEKLSLISFRESNSFNSFKKDYPNIEASIVPDVIFSLKKNENIGYGDSVKKGISEILYNYSDNYFPLQYSNPDKIKQFDVKSVQDYMSWLKSLDLYITGRFHGVCLAALIGTPFLAIASNAQKIEGILKDMECEELLINSLEEINTKKLLAVEKLNKISDYMYRAYYKINNLFDNIREL